MKKKLRLIVIVFLALLLHGNKLSAQTPGGVNTNLKFWIKANAGVTTSGSNVTTWTDQSGNGFNATQASIVKQPTFTTSSSAFNNNPSVNFDITDDGMLTSANFSTSQYSFFVVYNSTSTSTASRRGVQGSNNWLIGPYQNTARFYNGTSFVGSTSLPIGTKPTITSAISTAGSTSSFYFDGKLIAGGVSGAISPGQFIWEVEIVQVLHHMQNPLAEASRR